MEEEFIEIQEQKPKPVISGRLKKVFDSSLSVRPGCGSLLALKMSLQLMENPVLVLSSGSCLYTMTKFPETLDTIVYGASNAPAAASSLSRIFRDNVVLCFVDDSATREHMQSLLAAARRGENFIYVCSSNQGSCALSKSSDSVFPEFTKVLGSACYSATAAISHYDDFAGKIKKASSLKGVRFIEVLSPCPYLWKYDPSNTVELARSAVETGAWPLYEIEDCRISFTPPARLEPISRFLEQQKRFLGISSEAKQALAAKIEDNIKNLKKR